MTAMISMLPAPNAAGSPNGSAAPSADHGGPAGFRVTPPAAPSRLDTVSQSFHDPRARASKTLGRRADVAELVDALGLGSD